MFPFGKVFLFVCSIFACLLVYVTESHSIAEAGLEFIIILSSVSLILEWQVYIMILGQDHFFKLLCSQLPGKR